VTNGDDRPSRRLLFVCVENACRSQMAAAFARRDGGPDVEVSGAGSDPADEVNPRTVRLMAERGLDLSDAVPRSVDELPGGRFDLMVSMGCGDRCPTVPADRRLEWDLPDPKALSDEGFREVRDDIERRVGELLDQRRLSAADMERAREIWLDELGLPDLDPQMPWYGYSLGEWNDRLAEEAQRAVEGRYFETGEELVGQRVSTDDVEPNTSVYGPEDFPDHPVFSGLED
jgi:protein-tyrosine-phosphatase